LVLLGTRSSAAGEPETIDGDLAAGSRAAAKAAGASTVSEVEVASPPSPPLRTRQPASDRPITVEVEPVADVAPSSAGKGGTEAGSGGSVPLHPARRSLPEPDLVRDKAAGDVGEAKV
ncbi:MAG: hypothetical protein AB7F78_04155, partial [Hyphomicrobiaceae bacterium]